MTEFQSLDDAGTLPGDVDPKAFGHPRDVVDHPRLKLQEKRALLASWASDANAVPHLPTLRQLPDGSIVKVDEILSALKALDAPWQPPEVGHSIAIWHPLRRRGWFIRRGTQSRGVTDDDDDPPPCPAIIPVPPKGAGGAAFEYPDAVTA